MNSEENNPTPPTAARIERRLAAILHADVHGYSRLIAEDEAATLHTLSAHLALMHTLVRQHGGRAVGSRGDSLLAEFPSVVEAVQCAVEMQHELQARNAALPAERQVTFRMGANLGEIVVEGEQIHGDGINIAVRLEGLAEAGGICVSEIVYDQIKGKLGFKYKDLGERQLKNIAKPVRVYRIVLDSAGAAVVGARHAVPKKRRVDTALQSRFVFVLVSVLLLGGLVTLWSFFPSSFRIPHSEIRTQAEPPQALPLPDKPSIVVLPFVNMSKDPDQDYFSDGITEVLTSDLSRISSLFVIARNTAFTYKGKAANVQDVGKELGVRYVLEGSIQKANDQVRIVAQLIDTTTGGHIWSQRYDRPLKDIFALQDEIVQKIVTTLGLQLTVQEQGWIVRKHTDNLEAYDSFLRGVEYFWRNTKEAVAQARQMYEKAVALDPQYAEAYALLGLTYYREWIWRWSADPQTLERALALAQQAVALDDSLPAAHSLLSLVYARKQQYNQAIAEGEWALALNPNNADSYAWQAEVLNVAGRPEEALKVVKQAIRLNPRYPPYYLIQLGWAYSLTGRSAEAVATLKEATSRSPTHFGAHFVLALSYVLQWAFQQNPDAQTLEEAQAVAQRVIALNDTSPWGYVVLGHVYLWQKQYKPALAELKRAIALDPNLALSYTFLAETLSRVNRTEEALRVVEQALHRTPRVADEHLSSVGAAYALAGRYEEALAPLKQFLARYPNILGPHLTLAAVYIELGKEDEAQAEAAEVLRINPQFSLEVHRQRAPIKDPAMLERHLAALRQAGLK